MAFWTVPKQYYKIETDVSKVMITSLFDNKIAIAKQNTGFSSLFKYPDYKQIVVNGDNIIIKDVTKGRTNAGSIDMDLQEENGKAILYTRFVDNNNETLPITLFGLSFFVISIMIGLRLIFHIPYVPIVICGILISFLLILINKSAEQLSQKILVSHLHVVFNDLRVNVKIIKIDMEQSVYK